MEDWEECMKGTEALRVGREDWMESSDVAESPREWKYGRSPRSGRNAVGVLDIGESCPWPNDPKPNAPPAARANGFGVKLKSSSVRSIQKIRRKEWATKTCRRTWDSDLYTRLAHGGYRSEMVVWAALAQRILYILEG